MRKFKMEMESEKQNFEINLELNGKARMIMNTNLDCDCKIDLLVHQLIKKFIIFDNNTKVTLLKFKFVD